MTKKKLCVWMKVVGGILLCMAVSCRNGAIRRNAGTRFADSLPVRIDSLPSNPVVSIVDPVFGTSRFRYENGRMTGGECGRYGRFTVHSRPLAIEVKRRPDTVRYPLLYDARYENICIDDSGRAVSMDLTVSKFSTDDSATDDGACHIHYSMSYKDGYISELSFSLRNKKGNNQKGTVSYMWNCGELVTRVCDFQSRHYKYEEHVSQTYLYSGCDSLSPVNGIYLYDLQSSPYIHEFIWYTGLLGKPLKKLPVMMRTEWCGDCGSRVIKARLSGEEGANARKVVFADGTVAVYSYEMCP